MANYGVYELEGKTGFRMAGPCAQTDPEAFFPEKANQTRLVKKVCSGCEVRAQCLDYALDNDEQFGIWGGLTELERRGIKKRSLNETAGEAAVADSVEIGE